MGFRTSWKLTLVLSACGLPFIIAGFFVLRYGIRTQKLINLRMQQKAGGIAEELLYNIKTIASFANFLKGFSSYLPTFYKMLTIILAISLTVGHLNSADTLRNHSDYAHLCIFLKSDHASHSYFRLDIVRRIC